MGRRLTFVLLVLAVALTVLALGDAAPVLAFLWLIVLLILALEREA